MKIFNTQRMTLLKSQQFKRYLLYATGETILVIIGILIALGISNWNKNQDIKNANIELHNKVLVQLDKDIKHTQDFQKILDTLQETYLKALDRDYDRSKVNDNGLISTILFEVNTLSLDRHVNNLIDNAVLDNSKASLELVELNSTYKLYARNIDDIEKIIFAKVTTNLAEIEKTQLWYTELITDFICRNECINYLLHNEGHKSRVASLRFLYINGYGDIINGFLNDLIRAKDALGKAMTSSK